MKIQFVHVNPHYVARLIAPISMASDMEQRKNVFELLDFTSKDHVEGVIAEVIQLEYLRMTDDSRYKTKESLRFLLNSKIDGAASQVCSMLGLSDEEALIFLGQIWEFMFPSEDKQLLPDLKYKKNSTPLRFNEVNFGALPSRTLNESFEALRIRLKI